jgi:hypothetical protein
MRQEVSTSRGSGPLVLVARPSSRSRSGAQAGAEGRALASCVTSRAGGQESAGPDRQGGRDPASGVHLVTRWPQLVRQRSRRERPRPRCAPRSGRRRENALQLNVCQGCRPPASSRWVGRAQPRSAADDLSGSPAPRRGSAQPCAQPERGTTPRPVCAVMAASPGPSVLVRRPIGASPRSRANAPPSRASARPSRRQRPHRARPASGAATPRPLRPGQPLEAARSDDTAEGPMVVAVGERAATTAANGTVTNGQLAGRKPEKVERWASRRPNRR